MCPVCVCGIFAVVGKSGASDSSRIRIIFGAFYCTRHKYLLPSRAGNIYIGCRRGWCLSVYFCGQIENPIWIPLIPYWCDVRGVSGDLDWAPWCRQIAVKMTTWLATFGNFFFQTGKITFFPPFFSGKTSPGLWLSERLACLGIKGAPREGHSETTRMTIALSD